MLGLNHAAIGIIPPVPRRNTHPNEVQDTSSNIQTHIEANMETEQKEDSTTLTIQGIIPAIVRRNTHPNKVQGIRLNIQTHTEAYKETEQQHDSISSTTQGQIVNSDFPISVVPLPNSQTHNIINRVTCSSPCVQTNSNMEVSSPRGTDKNKDKVPSFLMGGYN